MSIQVPVIGNSASANFELMFLGKFISFRFEYQRNIKGISYLFKPPPPSTYDLVYIYHYGPPLAHTLTKQLSSLLHTPAGAVGIMSLV